MKMKKYLMTGVAALALCAGFTSCSHDLEPMSQEEITNLEAQKVVENYKQAFIQTFGQPASNHQWGFVNSSQTRTRALTDYDAGSNKNRNQWAGIDGPFKLVVPTPLSEGQKLRVQTYFQNHRFLTYEVPDMQDYFVQQVYTGSPLTAGPLSTEQYTSAVVNAEPITGAAHMDQLTIAGNHVWDFNGADNPNIADDVLNNGEVLNSSNKHSDQITLMLRTTPTYVGYQVSESSVFKNDCCALVGAQEIDDWINENYGEDFGKPVWYDKDEAGYDNSYWERSFVGLDYEQLGIEQCYTKKTTWTPNGNIEDDYAKVWDFCSDPNNTNWVLFGGEYVAASTIANDYLLNNAGGKVRWLNDDVNMFLGQNLGTDQNTFNKQATINGVNDVKYYDLDLVYYYINEQAALPKANNMEFIKNVGGRDYVFSDWIVTLAPAKSYVPDWNIRIIGEDLNATAQAGDTEDSDWDFNDVVIDVKFTGDNTCDIRIAAAGGTLPLIVGVANPVDGQSYDDNEIHHLFDQPVGVMVNTNAWKKNLPSATVAEADLPILENLTISGVKAANGANIPIYVEKVVNGEKKWFELQAKQGQPAAKIGVKPNFRIVDERNRIDSQAWYPGFSQWVQNQDYIWY